MEEGIAKVEQSLQVALQHDYLAAACRAYTNLGMLLAAIDREQALSYCHEGLALAKKIGDLSQQSWLHASVASSFCSLVGDCSQGIEAAEASIALDQQLGQRNHLPIPLILLAQIYQCQDRLDESERYYLEACAIAEEVGEPHNCFPVTTDWLRSPLREETRSKPRNTWQRVRRFVRKPAIRRTR